MTLLYWLLAGGAAGILAKKLIPKMGTVNWMFAGFIAIIGACVGGFAAALSGLSQGQMVVDVIVAFVGSMVVLVFFRQFLSEGAGNLT